MDEQDEPYRPTEEDILEAYLRDGELPSRLAEWTAIIGLWVLTVLTMFIAWESVHFVGRSA